MALQPPLQSMAYNAYDEQDAESPETSDKDSNTGLLPKSFFGDKELEPGKVCKVEIEHVYEDEVAVRYLPHSEDKEEEKEPEEEPAEPAEEEASAGPSTATSETLGPYD